MNKTVTIQDCAQLVHFHMVELGDESKIVTKVDCITSHV